MPRMRILTISEQEAFDKPPLFDHRERKQFLYLPRPLIDIATTLRSSSSQIGFLLMCGYFKATKRFYTPQDFHRRDIAFVAQQINLSEKAFNPDEYVETTRLRHQKRIFEFYGFRPFNKAEELTAEIDTMVKTHLKPRLIFDRCVDFLVQHRTQVPTVRTLTDLIRLGLKNRKNDLTALIERHLNHKTRDLLDNLFSTKNSANRYRLTLLKKLSHSTKPTHIKDSIADFETLVELHETFEGILSILNLGVAGTSYFAGSVLKSRMFQLQQRAESDRYIHAVAFVAHQFYRTQDHLTCMLLKVMASFQTIVSREHKEMLAEKSMRYQQSLKAVIDDLDSAVFSMVHQIRALTEDSTLSDKEKVYKIQSVLDDKQISSFEMFKAKLDASGQDQSWFDILESRSLWLQNRIKPILKVLNFEETDRVNNLMTAINHFKTYNGNITEHAPIDFLNTDERMGLRRYDSTFRTSLYKVFLFQHVAAAIKAGNLNIHHSYKYRAMDTYLIDCERWRKDRVNLLERTGLSEFINPEPVMTMLNEALTKQYQVTNTNVKTNSHLKVRVDESFHIKTPSCVADGADPFCAVFPHRHYVPLAQVLETINSHCNMLAAFEHWQQTHVRQPTSRPALFAGIIGLGCGIGIRKMARISLSITESELENTVNWRFSLDNIRSANDMVISAMDKMELPNIYRQTTDTLHTASDGQKFEVRSDSLYARSSFKYFGQGQGISAYTFVDERNFLWYSTMISASDRESAYVIDGLMHNDVIKSDIHSTDTHGYTEAIFGITHLLGFSFAPRIKGIGKQSLYIFKPKDRADKTWVIKPDKTINENLIREHWDDLLRLVATIKLKESTASDIFRRLNSYSCQHVLYQTLKAFGQIIKSLFILRYIDDIDLRQAIEKQLNKVELANRFTRAIAIGNPREFTQAEKEEQEIAESCNRLIKNSIICWNYLYLTRKLESISNSEEREMFKHSISIHSPMSWAHINMLGEYDFSDEKIKDSVGILPLKSLS